MIGAPGRARVSPEAPAMTRSRFTPSLLALLAALAGVMMAWTVLGQLGHPLLWNDEGYTAEFGRRVLVYGYPKVHDGRNTLYGLDTNIAVGTREGLDAYLGTPWAHYYVAALGVRLAEGVTDFHEKTAMLRAPFAVAGLLAILAFAAAGWRALGGSRRRRWLLMLGFLLSCATSVSLALHLREVRYYALTTLVCGAIFLLEAQPPATSAARRRTREAGVVAGLVLLFLTFFPSFFAMWAALAADRGLAARRAPGDLRARVRTALPGLVPLGLAALCVAPLMVFFETLSIARALSAEASFTLATYGENLGRALAHLAGQEALVAAAGMRAILLLVDRARPSSPARRLADLLWLFTLASLAVGARNPIFFERYYVALSPVLALACGLDAFRLWDAWPQATERPARWRAAQALVLTLAFLGMMAVRAPYLAGHLHELRHPLRGPLDYVIPYLADRFEDPAQLVIATNYEEPVFMFYLGSRVVVGFAGTVPARDRRIRPDVIVPRRAWGRNKRVLAEMLGEGGYERVSFPIADLQYNNRPALGEHHFRAEVPASLADWMEIFVRETSE